MSKVRWMRCTLASGLAAMLLFAGSHRGLAQPTQADIPQLEKACDGGDGRSCTSLGYLYDQGQGVKTDKPKAAKLFLKACDLGDAYGCNGIGAMYEFGHGLPKDYALALKYQQRSCDLGYARECLDLASQYVRADHLPKDLARAEALFQEGCDKDPTWACTEAGNDHLQQRAGPDVTLAIHLFTQGCEHGNSTSCADLGEVYEAGKVVAQDEARAVALFQKACDQANPKADLEGDWGAGKGCDRLAHAYQTGETVKSDAAKALALYRKACDKSWAPACETAGNMLIKGEGGEPDVALEEQLLGHACERGLVHSCPVAGQLYARQGDEAKAMSLYAWGCNTVDFPGDKEACRLLGETEMKATKDNEKALEAYWKACNYGSAQGCEEKKAVCQKISGDGEDWVKRVCAKK